MLLRPNFIYLSSVVILKDLMEWLTIWGVCVLTNAITQNSIWHEVNFTLVLKKMDDLSFIKPQTGLHFPRRICLWAWCVWYAGRPPAEKNKNHQVRTWWIVLLQRSKQLREALWETIHTSYLSCWPESLNHKVMLQHRPPHPNFKHHKFTPFPKLNSVTLSEH